MDDLVLKFQQAKTRQSDSQKSHQETIIRTLMKQIDQPVLENQAVIFGAVIADVLGKFSVNHFMQDHNFCDPAELPKSLADQDRLEIMNICTVAVVT